MIDTNITKVGGSLYVLIPDSIAKNLNLKNGSPAEVRIDNDTLITITIKKQEV